MPSENPHRGITMHQLPVAGDFPGLIFAVGSALIFLFAIPALWYVLVAAVVIGLVIAALLQVVHQRHPDETARLSLKI
jgi:type III secretory pathway component EscS